MKNELARRILSGLAAFEIVAGAACGGVDPDTARDGELISRSNQFGETKLILPKEGRTGQEGSYGFSLKESSLRSNVQDTQIISGQARIPVVLKVEFKPNPDSKSASVVTLIVEQNGDNSRVISGWFNPRIDEVDKTHELRTSWRDWKFNEILWDGKPLEKQNIPGK